MKKKFILAALSMAAIITANAAFAATQTVTMNVTMMNTASVTVSTTPINFGNVVRRSSLVQKATGTISVNASSGLPYKISIDKGNAAPMRCHYLWYKHNYITKFPYSYSLSTTNKLSSSFMVGHRWGDADFAATCSRILGGYSKSGKGTGTIQVHTVYATTSINFASRDIMPHLAALHDMLTVTVHY